MSLIASRDSRAGKNGAPIRLDHLDLDAWALCRDFVERMVADAQAAAVRDSPGRPMPEVDWESIWRAGEGAESDEGAMGRIIRAASEAARGIAVGAPEPVSPPVRGQVGAGAATNRPPTAGDGSIGLVGARTELVEPVTVDHPAPVLAADEPVTTVVEPVKPEPMFTLDEPPSAVVGPLTPAPGPALVTVQPPTAIVEPVTPAPATVLAPDEPVTAFVYLAAEQGDPVTAPMMLATSAVGAVTLDRPDPGASRVFEPEDWLIAEERPVSADDTGEAPKHFTLTHHEWATFFTWIRNLGAIILLFVAWQLWGTSISQHQAQSQLKTEFDAAVQKHHGDTATASKPTLLPASVRVPSPPDGSVVARLQVPAIGVDQYVVAGTAAAQLSQGPGHYDGTAMPGQAGNVGIAGHRTTHGAPFNRLGQLVRGDRIILTTLTGQNWTYVVSGTPQAVSPGDVAVLNYFGDNRITLTTCTPEFSAAQRLIAVGQLEQPAGTPHTTLSAKHVSYHIANSATASWDLSLLPAIGVELCLLLLLGLSYRRFDFWFGRAGKWFILVPLWTAGLYLIFATLTSFLPETL